MSGVANEQALFRSGHEAMRFAYAYSGQQYPTTIMARLMRGAGLGSGRGLFGLEGAAVAGTVKRHVESLSFPAPHVLAARYAITSDQAMPHMSRLVECVIPALGTGSHHRHFVQALICRYFRILGRDGAPVRMSGLADTFGLSADTVTRRWRAARDRLRELESRAQSQADEKLTQAGLVE